MQRSTLKYLVDVGLYSVLCSVATTGAILGWVIPPGRGGGPRFFLGLHRHDWADIHELFALVLLAVLALHLWLNWKWVVTATRRYAGTGWKGALGVIAGSWLGLVALAWLVAMFGSCLG